MRITRQQLTDLINEEISSTLLERQNRRLLEDRMDPMDTEEEGPMSVDDLIDFARAYAALSREDRKNLDMILDGRGESVTVEEVEDLQAALSHFHTGLADYLKDAHEVAQGYTDEDEDDGTFAAAVRMNR